VLYCVNSVLAIVDIFVCRTSGVLTEMDLFIVVFNGMWRCGEVLNLPYRCLLYMAVKSFNATITD